MDPHNVGAAPEEGPLRLGPATANSLEKTAEFNVNGVSSRTELPHWALRQNGSGGGIFFLRSEKRTQSSMGRAGGFYERQDDDANRKSWDSDDEEYDEFGRKKRRKSVAGAGAVKRKLKGAAAEEPQTAEPCGKASSSRASPPAEAGESCAAQASVGATADAVAHAPASFQQSVSGRTSPGQSVPAQWPNVAPVPLRPGPSQWGQPPWWQAAWGQPPWGQAPWGEAPWEQAQWGASPTGHTSGHPTAWGNGMHGTHGSHPSAGGSFTFEVELHRREGARLGIDVVPASTDDLVGLSVTHVSKGGVVDLWNHAAWEWDLPWIEPGDCIIGVNGVRADCAAMMEQLGANQELRVQLCRRIPRDDSQAMAGAPARRPQPSLPAAHGQVAAPTVPSQPNAWGVAGTSHLDGALAPAWEQHDSAGPPHAWGVAGKSQADSDLAAVWAQGDGASCRFPKGFRPRKLCKNYCEDACSLDAKCNFAHNLRELHPGTNFCLDPNYAKYFKRFGFK
mmetsp:Transcript_65562/g.182259  ORF Transcript_65562/g.182259 Transcript_65562/m.182259 type:complete len:506 (+) Transcript_65562:108-1625(+)